MLGSMLAAAIASMRKREQEEAMEEEHLFFDVMEQELAEEEEAHVGMDDGLTTGSRRVKWGEFPEGIRAVGDVSDTMPPGLYAPVATPAGLTFIRRSLRTDHLIRFEDSVVDLVLEEIENFWSSEAMFTKYDVPFKRGILLYGPPGSGKSCTTSLVCRDLIARGGIILEYNVPSFIAAAYEMIRLVQPETPIVVLMEDLDAIIHNARSLESQLLNLLDGVGSLNKVVFVATTNYPEKLGARIVNRPSRFDKRFLVPHPSPETRRVYLKTMLKGDESIDVERYVGACVGMSLAHLKELFVSTVVMGTPFDRALDSLNGMNEMISSLDTDGALNKILDRGYN